MKCFIRIFCFLLLAVAGQCWQYFISLNEILLNTPVEMELTHSTYYYGKCRLRLEELTFLAHGHLEHTDVLGKLIIRGWLDIVRIPTCIIIRATSYEHDTFRNTAYRFQICVPRITYCHTQKRFKFYYYEWYIPPDMYGGMNWDIYFYGPTDLDWE